MAFRGDSTGTYTFPSNSTSSTVDLGARNTYRYVNATNVYNKGKSDGITNPLRIGVASSEANGASFFQPELFEQYKYIKATITGGLFDCYTNWPSGGTLTRHSLTVNTQYLISDFLTSDIKRINLSGGGGTIFELYNS